MRCGRCSATLAYVGRVSGEQDGGLKLAGVHVVVVAVVLAKSGQTVHRPRSSFGFSLQHSLDSRPPRVLGLTSCHQCSLTRCWLCLMSWRRGHAP
jgi:hypothetical protein